MFFSFLDTNFHWPIIIGLPVTLLFIIYFMPDNTLVSALIFAGYVGSIFLKYIYWKNHPVRSRGSFQRVILRGVGGKDFLRGAYFSRGFSGGGFGGGGGSSGGGGAGGGF